MSLKTIRNLILILVLVILTFGLGYQMGSRGLNKEFSGVSTLVSGKTTNNPSIDFSIFWDVWDRLQKSYFDKKALNVQKMVYGAVSGMVSSLGDPYTIFLPPEQNKEAKDDLGGKFEGIGAQLGIKDKKIVVIAPLKGSPAEKAGILPGDWIVKVDDKETSGWTLPEAVSKIRGTKGTKVKLTLMQKTDTNTKDITVVRDAIKVASVDLETKEVNGKTVYNLKLSRFGDETASEWEKAVDEIVAGWEKDKSRISGLVLDLRNNPGGYLSGSVFIASEFLPDGTVVIQENSNGFKQNFSVNRKGRLLTIPMIILINKGSASASEIVAGALSVRGRAKLVGETTFGKGSIQEAQELDDGAGIHITTAKWLLPNGKWVNGNGVDPDVKILNDETKPEEDKQLEKAIELLK